MVDAYFCTPAVPNRVEINGSKDTVVIDGMMGQGTGGTLKVIGTGQVIESSHRNMYQGEITAFANAIITGGTPPVTGEDGLHSQQLVEAVYESATTGRLVRF